MARHRSGLPDFSDEERAVCELLRPHVQQAYRNAAMVTRLREGAGSNARVSPNASEALVVLDARGRIRSCPEHVSQWIAAGFGRSAGPGDALPEPMRAWSSGRQLPGANASALPALDVPIVVEREGHRLTARVLAYSAGSRILAIEQRRTRSSADDLRPLGLTGRRDPAVDRAGQDEPRDRDDSRRQPPDRAQAH